MIRLYETVKPVYITLIHLIPNIPFRIVVGAVDENDRSNLVGCSATPEGIREHNMSLKMRKAYKRGGNNGRVL